MLTQNKKITISIVVVVTVLLAFTGFFLRGTLFSFYPSHDHQADMSGLEFTNAGPFKIAAVLQPETPQVGKNQITIYVRNAEDQPVKEAEVRAIAEMPAMGAMPPMYAQADIAETAPGVYHGDFTLPMTGNWPLAIDVVKGEDKHVDIVFDMSTNREGLRLSSATPQGEVAYYTCSMHPSVRSAAPGSCPICGMDLIPVSPQERQNGTVLVEEGRRQTIGVKTGQVIKAPFSVPVRLQGEITYDPRRLTDISLRFNGWIGELNANFEGKRIDKGDVLFTVYSPELLSLQEEYLETVKRVQRSHGGDTQYASLLEAARKRLILWGLTKEQILWLEKQNKTQDYFPIFSPINGIVVKKSVVDGSAFTSGQQLFQLADLSVLWVEAFAYERDLPLLEDGMKATVHLSNVPRAPMQARIMHIDPFLENGSRTARVHLQLDNPDGNLRPGVFAELIVKVPLGERLLIPENAVLITGEKRFVFLDLGNGHLKPVPIRTGYRDGENIVVREGLQEGDAIVTSGTFLIASESKLKAGLEQW